MLLWEFTLLPFLTSRCYLHFLTCGPSPVFKANSGRSSPFQVSNLSCLFCSCKSLTLARAGFLLFSILIGYGPPKLSIAVAVQSLSHVWLCNPMDCRTSGLPVLHHLLEFAQIRVHWVGDAIQPFHPFLFSSPPAFNLSQHQDLFQRVGSSHQVA